MPRSFSCVLCTKSHLKEKNRKKVTHPDMRKYVCSILKREIKDDEVVCMKCRLNYFKDKKNQQSPTVLQDFDETDDSNIQIGETRKSKTFQSPRTINLQIPSSAKSHRRCIICKKESNKRTHMVVIPTEARTQAFIDENIIIHSNSRCCPQHLIGKYFSKTALIDLPHVSPSTHFNRKDLSDILERTRLMIKSTGKLNFENPMTLTNDDYSNLTGLTCEQFDAVASVVTTKIRSSDVRTPRTCLAILLVKLRTGLSNSLLATVFGLTKHQIQRAVHTAREAMMSNFVPTHLGFGHISHERFVKEHTTSIAKEIFGNEESSSTGILVMDGTYVYIQKSSHHKFQKLRYSLHKSRCLVKPMMVVGTDGYILSVLGPYFADSANNDASITKHAMKTNEDEINEWLQPNDVFVVDRGFRDVLDFLRNLGFQCEMPCYLAKGQSQHTTEEANSSRLVTKVRWVVESANGRVKQWKMLDKVVSNHYVTHIGDFVKIVCSIINCFRAPLISDIGIDELGNMMVEKSKKENHVKRIVEDNNLTKKRTVFSEKTDDIDFPRLSLQELRDITMGVYQIKQAKRYTSEHQGDDNKYKLYICKDRENLIRIKLSSRHSSSKVYNVWIEYSPDEITGWYCSCKIGARIVGCCAHVASVIWHLSYNRWEESNSTRDFETKMSNSILDSRDVPDTDTESEEEVVENIEE